jgi:hypothetical protein
VLLIGLAAAAGCSQSAGTAANGAAPAAAANQPQDSRGVIAYATYQVVVARDGDTMQTVAARVGTTPEALAQRNALPMDYRLREGEVLLLPEDVPRVGGFGVDTVETTPLPWSPERAGVAIDGAAGTTQPPLQGGQSDPLIDPVRHRVERGETA